MDPELGLGLIILAIGVFLFVRRLWFLRRAIVATGIVLGSSEGAGGTSGPVWASPSVKLMQFKTLDGRMFNFTALGGAPVGSHVSVLYHLDNPRKARINSFLQLWSFVLGWAGVGILVVVAAILTL